MELLKIAQVLLRRWWLIVIPLVIVIAITLPEILSPAASSGGFNTVIRYSAAQRPEAMPPRDGDYQDIWLASELTVNAFAAWTQTASFRDETVRLAVANGAEVNPDVFGIAADNARSVGQLFLSYPVEADLAILTKAAMEVLQTRNREYFPQVGEEPAEVTFLDTPVITPSTPPLTNRFGPFIKIALGGIAGLALATLAHYLDPMIRQREDLEALGLPVIGQLPRA